MKTSMSARRLLSLFAALALVVVVLLTVQARITASNVVSSPQAAVDQAGSSSSQPYYRSVVPTPGWRMAPTSDYAPVARSFHTPPTSPDRHR